MKYHDLVHNAVRPHRAVPARRKSVAQHRTEPEYRAERNDRFLETAFGKRRSRFVKATRRNFLRGALITASGAAAAATTSIGASKALARQSGVSASGSYPYRTLNGCSGEHATFNCRPGCGPTPVCNDWGCCGADGWFRNEPDAGFLFLDASYCVVQPLLGDAWLWEYYPDLDGADANSPCSHCAVIVFRCHDGQFYDFDAEVWKPGICRTVVSCEESTGSRLEPTPVPEETPEETPTSQATPEGTPEPTPDETPTPDGTPTATPTPGPDVVASGALTGRLDTVADATGGRVTVAGWIRLADSAKSINVDIDVDDERRYTAPANLARRDVALAEPGAGSHHGFAATIGNVAPGDHVVCVYGHRDGQRELLACSDVTIADGELIDVSPGEGSVIVPTTAAGADPESRPVGGLDVLRAGAEGGAYASGWAADTDRSEGPFVIAEVDGEDVAATTTGLPRNDVNALFPELGPNTGWSLEIPFAEGGSHLVCVYAIDPHDAARSLLGCQTISAGAREIGSTIPKVADTTVLDAATGVSTSASALRIDGAIDSATVTPATITVRGWCVDRNDPTKSLDVVIVSGGEEVQVSRTESRPDIAAALGVPDAVGFIGAVGAKSGRATVEAYAVSELGVRLALLGYQTVLVP